MILAPGRWNPTKIASCVMWFRANVGVTTSGGVVTSVVEQSVFHRTLSVGGSPTLEANVIGAMPGVKFSATNASLYSTDRLFAAGAARQVVTVCKAGTGPGGVQDYGGTIFSCPRGAAPSWTVQSMRDISPSVWRGNTDGATFDGQITAGDAINAVPAIINWRMTSGRVMSMSFNGTAKTITGVNQPIERDDVGFTIGNRTDAGAGQYFAGHICDSLAFAEVLSAPNERAVLQFFHDFYGITVS